MVFNIKKAFFLIELSIVILIIGILVTGVTQSSRLVSRIKLISLQSLTRSTDVVTVNGLSLWLETVLDNSITNSSGSFQISDNEAVSSWNDINP
jgi:prepilin-type N-terminal cleavage/methylation domain-containing protein